MISSINIQTNNRNELVDITPDVVGLVAKSKITNGTCRLFAPHTTAGITINENADSSVVRDILKGLEKLIPYKSNYEHAEGNSDAHIKSSIVGNEKTVFVENGSLRLGTWQGIFFCEFDGPRKRNVWVKIEEI